MENAPVIQVVANRVQPEYRDRYRNWVFEVYWPVLMKTSQLKAIDTYGIAKERPEYNRSMSIFQFDNMNDYKSWLNTQEFDAIFKDLDITWQSSRAEIIWSALYQLKSDLIKEPTAIIGDKEANIIKPPVIHLEGYRLLPEEEDKYERWFSKYGNEVFIPLLMKLPGINRYSWYQNVPYEFPDIFKTKRSVEYPPNLSIITFTNLTACEDYEKSMELAALRAGINTCFPKGLDFRWYVQYQLTRSWRK